MWHGQTGLLLFASVIQSATEWPHHLPSHVRASIGSLCTVYPLTSASNHFSLAYRWKAYAPLLTDLNWWHVFWQVWNWKSANTNIDLPRAFFQRAGMFSCTAEPDALLSQPWHKCSFLPVTSSCPWHWLGMAHISDGRELWRSQGLLWNRRILMGGLGEYKKVHCFGRLMPVLAGAALKTLFGHMT